MSPLYSLLNEGTARSGFRTSNQPLQKLHRLHNNGSMELPQIGWMGWKSRKVGPHGAAIGSPVGGPGGVRDGVRRRWLQRWQ